MWKFFVVGAALLMCGCGQFLPPDGKQTVEVKIVVDGDGRIQLDRDAKSTNGTQRPRAANEQCACGCDGFGCECSVSTNSKLVPTPLNDPLIDGPRLIDWSQAKPVPRKPREKPVVEMLTDFADGQCGACDLAWRDWSTNGKEWPFTLVKVRGNTLGGTSPTFRFPGGRVWRPQFYATGDVLREFSK